jgi:uncharacterized protein YcbK (DUF882 family)
LQSGSIAKKVKKSQKSIQPRKEKSCPKDALSLSSQQIFHPNTTRISKRVIKQHEEEEEEEEEEERERERENKRESLRRICRDITANTATRTSRTIPRPFEDNTFPDLNTKRT